MARRAPGAPPDLNRAVSAASGVSGSPSSPSSYFACEDDDGQVETRAQEVYETLRDMKDEQRNRIAEVVECTGVSDDDAFMALRRYGWEASAFFDAFFEDGDRVRRAIGISEVGGPSGSASEPQLCGICFCDPGEVMLPCELWQLKTIGGASERHPSYCSDCWGQYLQHAVNEGKACLDLRCIAPGCNEAVRPSTFCRLVSGDELERYERFATESLIDDSRGRARWCPGQNCGRAAPEPASGEREIICPCGTTWCFDCGTDAHLPVPCETVKRWEEKDRVEAADRMWIKLNTKMCPTCQNPIEKNGGCMHMTCRKPGGCGHEFCWICMGDWRGHETCNREGVEADANRENSRSDLLRYAHYAERFMAHQQAEKFSATAQLQHMEALEFQLVSFNGYSLSDVSFLTTAVRQIQNSRRFLKWTYAHGFFAKYQGDQSALFEFHQAQLEGTLERLSDIMENTVWDAYVGKDVEAKPFYDLRMQLISLTGVVHEFFAGLREALMQ